MRKIVIILILPLTVLLAITFILYNITTYLGKPICTIYTKETDEAIIYSTLGVDVIEYTNSCKVEQTEKLIGVYNIEAGIIDNWTYITYDEYTRYLDDFVYVNGEVAGSEDFGDYLIYDFDNGEKLKVFKNNKDGRSHIEYTHEVDDSVKLLNEVKNETEQTITKNYNNNVTEVYQLVTDIISSKDSIKIVKINIFNIFMAYLVLLALNISICLHSREEATGK